MMLDNPSAKAKPRLGFVLLSMFILGIGQSIEFAVMPMLGRELGLHLLVIDIPGFGLYQPKELAITVLASITALSFSFFTPIWGRLSDRHGRKPFIVLGLLGYAFGMLLFCFVAWLGLKQWLSGFVLFFALFAARIVHSALKSASFPSSNAYVIDAVDISQRTRSLGGLASATQIGSMCGPVLTFLVALHFLAPFLLMAVLTCILAALIAYYLPLPASLTSSDAEGEAPATPGHLSYLDARYKSYVLLCFCVYTSMGMVQQTLGFYFQDVLALTAVEAAKQFSLSMVVSSAAMLFAQLAVVQRIQMRAQTFIAMGLPSLLVSFALLSMASSMVQLLIAMALFGFGLGLIGPSLASAASQTVSSQEQGGLSGIMASTSALGFVLGPLLGGLIYSFSPAMVYGFAASLVFCLIINLFLKNLTFLRKRS